jgi:ABC-2 type transport system ATP-binding protein
VDALDLDVRPGDLYGFLGPNGSGKTTAIRCILGLISRDAGEVEICGERDPVRQRQEVGSLVETPRFYDWMSARANLEISCAYAGRGSRSDVEEALQRVGLKDRSQEAVRGFSLGMRQRLGIARAIVTRPKLLILDEPTNGLDPRGMREVRELLQDLVRRDGLTVFISSHLLAEIELLCNRVAIIDGGKRVQEGLVADLKQDRQQDIELIVDLGLEDRNLAPSFLARDGRGSDCGRGGRWAFTLGLKFAESCTFQQKTGASRG